MRRSVVRIIALPLALLASTLTGCASNSPSLTVRSEQTDKQFVANFDRAIFSQSDDGQLDLILLDDAVGRYASVGLPLQARPGQRLKQVVHLRVLWSPRRSIRIDSPSASNATINWHVIADANDHLSYTGACWANIDVDDDKADVDLRNATITIRSVAGKVADPLKRARLEGSFVATRADHAVRSYLDEIASFTPATPPPTAMTQP